MVVVVILALVMTKKIAITLEVANDAQAMELNDAWQEIVSGQKLERAEVLEHGTEAIMEAAQTVAHLSKPLKSYVWVETHVALAVQTPDHQIFAAKCRAIANQIHHYISSDR